MSHPSGQLSGVEAQVNDAGAPHQAESLEQRLESMNLNDGGPIQPSEVQHVRRKRLSARDLLEGLDKRRLEITRINFTTGSAQAGRGSHGEVVVATLGLEDGSSSEPGDQVAVKKFILSGDVDEEKFLRTFANELHILDRLDHNNIIKLIGFVEDIKKGIAWLVFPWEANGNVREFHLSGKWELPERVSLIKDVASGVEYLHSRQPPIRHGDLKSLNVLVNSDNRAILTDFGSARIQTEARGSEAANGSPRRQAASTDSNPIPHDGAPEVTVSMTSAQLTLTGPSWSFRWAAPEILNDEEPCLASDIWALGWIAWEIMTDNYPFPEAKTNKAITVKVVTGLLPPLYDDSQLSQIGDLCYVMVRCWKAEPKERFSVAEVQSALQWIPSVVPRTGSDGISQTRSAPLLVEMGDMHRVNGKYDDALKFFEEAFAIAQSAKNKRMMTEALSLAADCHRLLGHHDKAEESCNQSLAICTSPQDSVPRADALFMLGKIHQDRSNPDKAEESFKQALDIYPGTGPRRGQANTLVRLGMVYHMRSHHPEAEQFFNQALAIFTSIGDDRGQANAVHYLGVGHQAQSNYTKAEESFNHALTIYTRIGDNIGRAHGLVGLAEALIPQGRASEAKRLLDDAAHVSHRIDYVWGQNRSKTLLAKVLELEKSSSSPPL